MTAALPTPGLTDAEREALVQGGCTCGLPRSCVCISDGIWSFEGMFAAVEAILRDRLPEATTVTERRARHRSGEAYYLVPAGETWGPRYVMEERVITTYAPHVGPWEESE